MKLQTIDKVRYRYRLNRLLAACAGTLLIGSLVISTGLIALFGQVQGDNFYFNLAGVILSGVFITSMLIKYKHHPLMHEIHYVWLLKQQLNLINRKLLKLDKAAAENNVDALIILNFSYQGSMQLWQLDDNTITLDVLNNKITKLEQQVKSLNVEISCADYDAKLLKQF